ncbi:hypothetical protein LPTSP4_15500 [Leptospira ryugenii]|uniref:Outer membrane protein n=1 Tax=Leptospira ryugenii TaxID=1917863 RepID=A0A2P2DZI0_9LEPT|nr:hypothetical protein [Leptospira ryugenii]GBF50029.1 hypothetical protein LPTSP4_15500 [Leptospira ryugenii]
MSTKCEYAIAFFILFLFANTTSYSKDFDTILEKPFEKPKPDQHRVFFRLLGGDGSMFTPAQGELIADDRASTIASGGREFYSTAFTTLFGPRKDFRTSTTQFDLEYRYLDKFRILYETRTIVQNRDYNTFNSSGFGLSSVPLDYSDKQKRLGFAYFFPIAESITVGLSLRHVELNQITKSDFGTIRSVPVGSAVNRQILAINGISDQNVKYTGLVPGIGFEFKPLSWFEIHLQHLYFNLKGNDIRNDFAYVSLGNSSASGFSFGEGDASYKGYSQTIDFVFRYSSWFATRWGYTRENFTKTNKVYSFSNIQTDPIAAIASSLLTQSLSDVNVKYGSYNVTIEFSKGFGN